MRRFKNLNFWNFFPKVLRNHKKSKQMFLFLQYQILWIFLSIITKNLCFSLSFDMETQIYNQTIQFVPFNIVSSSAWSRNNYSQIVFSYLVKITFLSWPLPERQRMVIGPSFKGCSNHLQQTDKNRDICNALVSNCSRLPNCLTDGVTYWLNK